MQSVQKNQSYGNLHFPEIVLNKDIRGILLDIDNTIYSYDKCHEYAMKQICKYVSKEFQVDQTTVLNTYSTARRRVGTDLSGQGSSHSRLLYFQKMLEMLTGKTEIPTTLYLEELYWSSFFSVMTLDIKAEKFIENCNKSNIAICIITDLTAQIQMRKLQELGVVDQIDFLVSSEEAGVEKPHPYIFKLALEKLQLDKDSVLVVGDNVKKDISGADILNIRSVYVGE